MNRLPAILVRLIVLLVAISGALVLVAMYRLNMLLNPFAATNEEFLTGFFVLMAWLAAVSLMLIFYAVTMVAHILGQIRRALMEDQTDPVPH